MSAMRTSFNIQHYIFSFIVFVKYLGIPKSIKRVFGISRKNVVFFKSSTLPGGFTHKKTLLVSPIWTWICITTLTHADFKIRIRSHEKPENLDSTWSKHDRKASKTLSISRLRLTDNVSLAKTDRLKCETTLFRDGSNPMISFDPKCFKAVRSSLEKIWRRCFEERIVEVSYRGLNLQMHKLFAVGPH